MDDTLLAARLVLYALFQRTFASEPDDGLFEMIDSEVASDACAAFASALELGDGKSFADAFGRFRDESLNAWACSPERVRADYTRLFVGPAALPSPPWESAHRQGALFQTSTLEVRRAYAAQGLAAEGSPREADDHLAMELDFMRVLCERAIAALGAEDVQCAQCCIDAQRSFLDEHLLVWVGSFAQGLAREDATVYPVCASLVGLFVRLDRDVAARDPVLRGEGAA